MVEKYTRNPTLGLLQAHTQSMCVSVCVCVSVRASLAKLLGRFQPNFHQMVPHWSSGVRLCFGSLA